MSHKKECNCENKQCAGCDSCKKVSNEDSKRQLHNGFAQQVPSPGVPNNSPNISSPKNDELLDNDIRSVIHNSKGSEKVFIMPQNNAPKNKLSTLSDITETK